MTTGAVGAVGASLAGACRIADARMTKLSYLRCRIPQSRPDDKTSSEREPTALIISAVASDLWPADNVEGRVGSLELPSPGRRGRMHHDRGITCWGNFPRPRALRMSPPRPRLVTPKRATAGSCAITTRTCCPPCPAHAVVSDGSGWERQHGYSRITTLATVAGPPPA